MVEIWNLAKIYKSSIHALGGITLSIQSGVFGLLGPNGAGKTTLMRILATLLRPTAGSVRVLGHDATDPKGQAAIRHALGYLPQDLGLYPELTAPEFLDYVGCLKCIPKPARQQQVRDLIETVGLGEGARRRIKTYSGGMKRRLGIAQALLGDPRLLIIDEPTSGLDPEERVRLRNLLANLGRERLVILSTHIVEDISQACGDMAVLYQGRVLFHGPPDGLIERVQGKAWSLTTNIPLEAEGLVIVAQRQVRGGIQYRVLGEAVAGHQAVPVEPSLEDGYLWLKNGARQSPDRPDGIPA